MESKTVTVPNISCGHCANLIDVELRELGGVQDVSVDVPNKTVVVKWEAPADWGKIEALLEEIEYPVAA